MVTKTAYSRGNNRHSFHYDEQHIIRLLAGKAATEIVLGEPYIGCNADLQLAFAKKILIDNRCFLDAIVDGLMKKHTLTCSEIQAIRSGIGMIA